MVRVRQLILWCGGIINERILISTAVIIFTPGSF